MKTSKLLLCCYALLLMLGCKKEGPIMASPGNEPSPYYIRMTDAPATYSAVFIDLQAVEVTGAGGPVTLNVNPGIYNLLNFSNGMDTLIAYGNLNMSKVEQIRLILGPNNSIVTLAGVSHPLSTPSAQQSGLKIQVHHTLQAGVAYYVLLDFDASQSIVEQGNGGYSLKPVIRAVEIALSGSIRGRLSQQGVPATVTATSGSQSYSTMVSASGEFLISGLPPGTYSLTVNPIPPYNNITQNNITVTTGSTTNVGTITI